MRPRGNILILTAGYGDGHMQVSKTIQTAFHRHGLQRVRILDLFQEAHPMIDAIAKFLYSKSLTASAFGFDYYGWSYYLTRDMERDSALGKWLNRLGSRKLAQVMKREMPDAVISTFPFGGIDEHLRRYGLRIPTFTVVTDFALHNRWVFSASDRFYVATEDLKAAMIRRGIPEERILVSGIPVREPFYQSDSGEPADNGTSGADRSILILGGAYNVLRIRKITDSLRRIPNVRISVVCGRNEKLYASLKARFLHDPEICVYGFVESMHELMKRSACIVTKAGGVTLSEAIHVPVPIVIFKPFSGQEKENARYLAAKGAAAIARNVRELTDRVERVVSCEASRREMLDSLRSLQAGHAAAEIVQDVLRVVAESAKTSGGSIA